MKNYFQFIFSWGAASLLAFRRSASGLFRATLAFGALAQLRSLHIPAPTFRFLSLAAALFILNACEDPIDLDLEQKEDFVVIDAFINNLPGKQIIKISKSTPYLSSDQPAPLLGASVILEDSSNGRTFVFSDNGNGEYSYEPTAGDSIGVINHRYKLTVQSQGNTWTASETWNRSTEVDTIDVRYEEPQFGDPGYFARFLGIDSIGKMDYYWIKAFRNGVFWGRAGQMNLCVDGAFGEGGDGLFFIPPIAEGITPFNERYKVGDVVRVEIHGISKSTYEYLTMAQEQMTNSGLFAVTPENVPTNFTKITSGNNKRALGWFSVASVKFREQVVNP